MHSFVRPFVICPFFWFSTRKRREKNIALLFMYSHTRTWTSHFHFRGWDNLALYYEPFFYVFIYTDLNLSFLRLEQFGAVLTFFLHTAEYTGSWQGFPIILSSFLTNGRQGGKNYISIFHSFLVLACVTIFWGKRREVYFWGEVDYPQPIFFSFIFCKYSEILKRNKSLKI